MLQGYMKAMKAVITGGDLQALEKAGILGLDAKYARVYRNNSVSAFADVLRANYKTVHALVGDDFFCRMALAYIDNYPTHTRTLVGYGEDFTHVIEDFTAEHKLAYLLDFAFLDRAWTHAHLAANSHSLKLDGLNQYSENPEQISALNLTFIPSVQIIETKWDVIEAWLSIRYGGDLMGKTELLPTDGYSLLWRYDNEVKSRKLNSLEFIFLSQIAKGAALGAALNTAIYQSDNVNEAEISGLLPSAVHAGLFRKRE